MKKVIWAAVAAVVVACVFIDYRILSEAYGDGPPYYGGTVNMDKWTNPVPLVLAVQGVGVATIGLLLWRARATTK
ncbi:MAG: hypothetical protein ABUS79_15175 [Pseudomonadota bacterium]